jgi:quercetin dioxygenase-like cupin family protein
MTQDDERLRPRPSERFEGDCHFLDLGKALRQLRAEPHRSEHGHRHVTIFHRKPVAHVLFAFEPDGFLADHSANGLVTIQALEGHLTVDAAGAVHELESGMLVILQPGVSHSVRASATSAMLLTVIMESSS